MQPDLQSPIFQACAGMVLEALGALSLQYGREEVWCQGTMQPVDMLLGVFEMVPELFKQFAARDCGTHL